MFLQATEDFLVHLMEDTNLCALHAKRVTISKAPPAPPFTSLFLVTSLFIQPQVGVEKQPSSPERVFESY